MSVREKKQRRKCKRLFVFLLAVIALMGYYIGTQGKAPHSGNGFQQAVYAGESVFSRKPMEYSREEVEGKLLKLSKESEQYQQIYDNRAQYPDELLSALCNNPEMLDFALGYTGTAQKASDGLKAAERREKYPLLLQWDERWGYVSYGNGCIGLKGCAPTCIAMACQILRDDRRGVTPDKVAKYAEKHGYYQTGTGTAWSLMTEGSSHFGIRGEEISLNRDSIKAELEAGHPVICSMRAGDFTTQGHFIVLASWKEGKIQVLDPNSKARSDVLWDYDRLERQIKNLWAFQRFK